MDGTDAKMEMNEDGYGIYEEKTSLWSKWWAWHPVQLVQSDGTKSWRFCVGVVRRTVQQRLYKDGLFYNHRFTEYRDTGDVVADRLVGNA
jgi:hypothetical protein